MAGFVGVFDLFRIGIGPSSSHTVGPMRAAGRFLAGLRDRGMVERVAGLRVDLYGSLAATGDGHGTPGAILAGLMGQDPESVDIPWLRSELERIAAEGTVDVDGRIRVPWLPEHLTRRPFTVLERHPNALRIRALDAAGDELADETWYSVGGGFVHREGDPEDAADDRGDGPLPFTSAAELLARCDESGLPIWEVMRRGEEVRRGSDEIDAGIARIHAAMTECIAAGLGTDGRLPGGLDVRRRAREWHRALLAEPDPYDARFGTEWLNVVAIAVNEENAAGGRVVTAPTNGAAGIIPAVLAYALLFVPGLRAATPEVRANAIARYLLTAAAIGSLYKRRASISGAEVGCQGEVGSASSMAAAGITELLGGSPRQVENAAEIAMEHNLGLSCDPVGGLVQIPCIERNAIAAAKAVNAATMAMRGNGEHRVSLDQAIETMRQTGKDMSDKYKETSRGGLAVNVIEC